MFLFFFFFRGVVDLNLQNKQCKYNKGTEDGFVVCNDQHQNNSNVAGPSVFSICIIVSQRLMGN